MLLEDGMNYQPLQITTIKFSFAKISFIRKINSNNPNGFINYRTGLSEWMAWVWSAHEPHILHSPCPNDMDLLDSKINFHIDFVRDPFTLWQTSLPTFKINDHNEVLVTTVIAKLGDKRFVGPKVQTYD